ncbi:MAG: tRNA (adenosine(37)-N6)-threonylcarbamoyltransferase complex ATPase subunit type 1 TsaE [Terriglobia bacterium]
METLLLYDIVTNSPEETMAFGRKLAAHFQPPAVVLLEGDLGSGKTTLAKGIAVGLGVAREEEVTSPSFTLVHEYSRHSSNRTDTGADRVFHVDLYRIENSQEIRTLGLDEIFDSRSTVLIEWGERLPQLLPRPFFKVRLEYLDDIRRRIQVRRYADGK